MIEFDREEHNNNIPVAKITVIGVGGAGGNTVNCMIQSEYEGVNFICVNTDAQALKLSQAPVKIQIGQKSTKGLGAGANPDMGKKAAEEDLEKVLESVGQADIVFLTGGMGGGTGSGALPVIVQALKERGILTIVVITKPFAFEGKRRLGIADQAISKIKTFADTLLIIPNQKLLDLVDEKVSMIDGFAMINEVLNQSVKGISDIITRAGHINVDFADVREIMRDQGLAVMGTGRASGADRARKAALAAISSPILENMNIAGARGVLLNITGGVDLGLHEISQAASVIYEQADEQANIILGSVIDNSMGDEIAVTVIATGFKTAEVAAASPAEPAKLEVKHVDLIPAHAEPVKTAVFQEAAREVVVEKKPEVVITPVVEKVYVAAPQAQPVYQEVVAAKVVVEEPVVVAKPQEYVELVQEYKAPVAQDIVAQLVQENLKVEAVAVEQEFVQKVEPVKEVAQERNAHYFIPQKQEQPTSSVQHYHENKAAHIDVKDLDVPAFMRKQAKEKMNAE
jgi:cell division protein FtsZ